MNVTEQVAVFPQESVAEITKVAVQLQPVVEEAVPPEAWIFNTPEQLSVALPTKAIAVAAVGRGELHGS